MTKKRSLQFIVTSILLVFVLAGCVPTEAPAPTMAPATEVPPTAVPPTATIEPTATTEPTATPQPTVDTGYDAALLYAGKWEGEWVNVTFGSKGPIVFDVVINPDGTIEFSMDVGGFVFGLLDPKPQVYTGTFDTNGAEIKIMEDPTWGKASITMSADGQFEFKAELVPDVEIASMMINGTFSPETVDGTYLIEFAGGAGSADGTIALEKVSE